RVFSFGLILSIAFMLIISLVVSTVLTAASDYLQADSSKFLALLFEGINFMVSIAAISLLFALMFKYLPDAHVKWKHVWVGGLVTGLLFTLGKTLLAFYFGKADPGSGYGAAGSIILILLWVNYSSMILFLGAEFTHTYADMREGKPLEAKKDDAKEKQATGEVGVIEEEQKDKEPSYGVLRAVPFVLPILAVFNYILPFLLPLVAKRVAARYGVAITLRRVAIGLFKPTIATKDLTVRYGNSVDGSHMVFASVPSISLDYARSAFFRKQLQVEAIKITKPELEVVMGKTKEKAGKEETKPQLSSTTPSILPIIVKRLSLESGLVGYKNPETKPSTQINIEAIDIFAQAKEEGFIENVDYAIELDGKLLDGKVKAVVNLRAGFKKPTFDMKLELASLNLKMLNDFFMAYAGIDIHKGRLDVFSEASVVQNNINGHIKPLISDLEMLGPEDKNKDALSKIKEAAIGFVKESLENQTQDQVATDIPISGKLDNPDIGILRALGAVTFNIFIRALRPNFNTLFEERFEKLMVNKSNRE
ncbi:MAG: YihY/virulence factor BrkB family protein, partial [Bacteroidetes bacterium]|nr:YihY/virulence factor BrkB family protein [Bacteroidota bacterium]